MNSNDTQYYSNVRVLKDDTNGLVKLSAVERHGQERKTKLKNNFTGLLTAADPELLGKISQLMSDQMPPKTDNEIIVGLAKSGIIMAGFVALARKSRFNWSTTDQLDDHNQVFSFTEGRLGKHHYLHGLKPGDEVIVVEDEVTSGAGPIQLITALREYGVKVRAVASAIETVNFGAREKIQAQTGLSLIAPIRVELVQGKVPEFGSQHN